MDMAIAKYMWVVHNAVAQPSTTNLIRQTDLYCRVCVRVAATAQLDAAAAPSRP